MLKLKKIEEMFPSSYRDDTNQILCIRACNIDKTYFYDYGEAEKPFVFPKEYSFLEKDHRIHVVTCKDCGECAGW